MPSPRQTGVVKAPLRWVYPKSYRALESMAQDAGIQPHEFQALVGGGAAAEEAVTLRKDAIEWRRAFSHDDLVDVGEAVWAFFTEVIGQMVQFAKADYQDLMSRRDV